ncbi:sensor histidine kinase (plasmid) [Streptomyces sp. BI20]|uniref:sensor histidine kinase n=1 Tax=Streptomyces sp. BI20 TaxID=3403460 RepID=UPI003C763007
MTSSPPPPPEPPPSEPLSADPLPSGPVGAGSAEASAPRAPRAPLGSLAVLGRVAAGCGLALLVLADLALSGSTGIGLLVLAAGAATALLALAPDDPRFRLPWRLTPTRRAATAVGVSLATTLALWAVGGAANGWGLLESAALLALILRTARRAPTGAAVGWCLALGGTFLLFPFRLTDPALGAAPVVPFLLAAGAAAGGGAWLRDRARRRAAAVDGVRSHERALLARDLHDFVAHHATGIVLQAQAARLIRATDPAHPERLDPILADIERAGQETIDSMRRLVRVLRESEDGILRPGDLATALGHLANGHRPGRARLEIEAGAAAAHPPPEVATTVHRMVQEALTNVRRHVPGAPDVLVRLGLAEAGRALVVEVSNGPADGTAGRRRRGPVGGPGGLGLVGLRERFAAVDGTLTAGPTAAGGWQVRGSVPLPPPHGPGPG